MPRVNGVRIGTRFLRSALRAVGVASRSRAAPAGRGPDRRRPACARSGGWSRSPSTTRWRALGAARRSGARGQDHRQDHRRQPGGVLEARLVLPVLQHLPPHDARLHPRARAAAQARAALRPGAGRGEHAQPAVAAVARRRRADAGRRPSCRASSSSLPVASPRARDRSICWWSRATSGACASTPTSSIQGNTLTLLDTSLSENNLFGWRKYLSVRFSSTRGRTTTARPTSTPTSRGRG